MRHAFLTVDLGFGDAGKGAVVDFLTRQYAAHTVVRYNGGAQAGHRVVLPGPEAREHVFSQFGSGTLAGAATHLTRFMLIEPLAMLAEARHLRELGAGEPFARTTIDARALVITPFARAVNRLSELARGDARHGSCGMGVGETMIDYLAHGEQVLFAGDLADRDVLYAKLRFLRTVNQAKLQRLALPDTAAVAAERAPLDDPAWAERLLDQYRDWADLAQVVPGSHLHKLLRRPGAVVFEAAQGVLLDEWYGFHPHTTWSTTTLANADRLLAEAGYDGGLTRVGITRAYATRHGAGPLPSEDAALTAALPDAANRFGAWQQGFRVGWLDLVLLRYALAVVGRLDTLALTCLDRLAGLPEPRICRAYRDGEEPIERLPAVPGAPSLAHQEQLTALLQRACPQLAPLDGAGALPALLAADLGLPVGLRSYGPSAADIGLVAGAGL